LASTTGIENDDVYYTQAKAGDEIIYVNAGNKPNVNEQYNDDDYYYYYGDYASRINRFGYFSPFSYYDNYYGYSPFNRWGFGLGFGFNTGFWNGYYSPFMYSGMYSPYFYDPFFSSYYGYSPFYGYGYSPYGWGGYGGFYGYGGYGGYYGGLGGFGGRPQNARPVYAGGVARPGTGGNGTRSNTFLSVPDRRQPSGTSTPNINNATRGVRTPNRDPRPVIQQVDRQPSYSPPPSNAGGGGGGNGGGGGGGGRPVRP